MPAAAPAKPPTLYSSIMAPRQATRLILATFPPEPNWYSTWWLTHPVPHSAQAPTWTGTLGTLHAMRTVFATHGWTRPTPGHTAGPPWVLRIWPAWGMRD